MDIVEVRGHAIAATLSSGRVVEVMRGDDGSHYGFKFGPDDDGVSFCLSREAVEFVLFALRELECRADDPESV